MAVPGKTEPYAGSGGGRYEVPNPTHACPHERTILRIEQDMYYGNGKPGMTTRMESMETCVGRIDSSLRWIVRLLVGSFVSGLAAIIVALVMGHKG